MPRVSAGKSAGCVPLSWVRVTILLMNEDEKIKKMKALGVTLIGDHKGERHLFLVDEKGEVRPVPEAKISELLDLAVEYKKPDGTPYEREMASLYETVLKGWRPATEADVQAARARANATDN